MADRPILFSGPMVRAFLEGRKTQTRRVLKPQPDPAVTKVFKVATEKETGRPVFNMQDRAGRTIYGLPCKDGFRAEILPPFAAGDRLWVREAHALLPRTAYRASVGTGTIEQVEHPSDGYSAAVFREGFDRSGAPRWRPSIHMPRWAARLTLIVTEVRVERLQDITPWDALAEGMCPDEQDGGPPDLREVHAYRDLWNSLNAKRGFGWDTNPWVVAVTVTTHRQNIDTLENGAR